MQNKTKDLNDHIIKYIIGAFLAKSLHIFIESLSNDVIIPLTAFDFNKDGIDDLQQLRKYKVIINNKQIMIGKFFINIVQTILFFILGYYLYLNRDNFY